MLISCESESDNLDKNISFINILKQEDLFYKSELTKNKKAKKVNILGLANLMSENK